jgi:hypothetical protein
MSTPDPITPPPQSSKPPADNGSLLIGFVLGWVAMVVGVVVNAVFWALQSSLGLPGADIIFMGVGTLPLLAMIALAVWFSKQGKSRSALGVLVAFGSMLGLLLLLVAACFGILLTGGFGSMH